MIQSKDIELFKNLSQGEYCGKYIDFHNDFYCIKIVLLKDRLLVLLFKRILDKKVIRISFTDVSIERMEFFNFSEVENLTIDNLYRGKVEKEGELLEFKNRNSGYFYLEFDEGQKLEFWSIGLTVGM